MKKTNFYWIIAAFVIFRMTDIQSGFGNNTENVTTTLEMREPRVEPVVASNFLEGKVVSGRWMR